MKVFKYSLISKLLYRYGNIPLNLILFFYAISALLNVSERLIFIVPFIITITFLFFLNRQYLLLYKLLPYKITADSEKLICEDFLFSNKKVVIYYLKITQLKGGVFEGKVSGLMHVYDQDGNTIGFFNRLKNVNKLETEILGRVPKEVYDVVVEKIGLKRKPAEGELSKAKDSKNTKHSGKK